MGRRVFKKVISGTGTIISHQRYIYRGYLQIACVDLTRTNHPALWLITWDPTQAVATRPLAIQKDGTWYTYGLDLTKNVCEIFGPAGNIRTAYTYTPYGSVTSTGNVTQPIQWSSEFYDEELGLVYYNWRYYNTQNGRWLKMDPIGIRAEKNMYSFLANDFMSAIDLLGLNAVVVSGGINTNTENDEDHDKNWRNFIDAAKIKFGMIRNNCNGEKEWIVNKNSYIIRSEFDHFKEASYTSTLSPYNQALIPTFNPSFTNYSDPISTGVIDSAQYAIKYKGLYVSIIERIARELGVTLRWYSTKVEFLKLLATQPNGKRRMGGTKITQLAYYGHGYIGKLCIVYGGGGNIDEETVTANDFPTDIFNKDSLIELFTCHSASKYINLTQKSIAEELYDRFGGVVVGFNGRVDYAPVAKGHHPIGGTTVSKEAEVDVTLLDKKKSNDNPYFNHYLTEIKPTRYGV